MAIDSHLGRPQTAAAFRKYTRSNGLANIYEVHPNTAEGRSDKVTRAWRSLENSRESSPVRSRGASTPTKLLNKQVSWTDLDKTTPIVDSNGSVIGPRPRSAAPSPLSTKH